MAWPHRLRRIKTGPMDYISTRGAAPVLAFDAVVLAGLARDGGLYLPKLWPKIDPQTWRRWRGLSYAELGAEVMQAFVGDSLSRDTLDAVWQTAVGRFRHPAIAPLAQLDHNLFLLELVHGPTLAFKDYALQVLGGLFDHILAARGTRLTIVGATSGDTGSAAIEACRDREAVDIFMLFPAGRVSEVQQRLMTTVPSANVHCLAIDGSFDDCQDLVKALFNDLPLRDALQLSAVNSINWARILAQSVYTIWAGLHLGAPERALRVAVPTGNFGNAFSVFVAQQLGLNVAEIGIASNANDILTRYFSAADMSLRRVVPTLSPSMDIQVSSNFERYLFTCLDGDAGALAALMQDFRASGRLDLPQGVWQRSSQGMRGFSLDDAGTLAAMKDWYLRSGQLLDPHTAIGVAQAALWPRDLPNLALATAHPAKFPDAVLEATGAAAPLPPFLADLMQRPERFTPLPNDYAELKAHIRKHARLGKAA